MKKQGSLAKASSLDPANFDAISGLVDVSLRAGRVDLARAKIDGLIRAGEAQPTFLAGLHYLRSRTFEAERNAAAAEKELLAAMSADPQYLPAYSGYAERLGRQNRTAEAISNTKRLRCSLRPKYSHYLDVRGIEGPFR